MNYVYDTQGNLLSAALPGSCTISYVTDGMNRRVAKKHNGDLEDQYVFEDGLRIAGKLDASGNLVQRYVYGTMSHSPDVILENGRTLRVITDHLGSPRLIVNSETGEILRSMNHDAWGRVLEDSNPMFSPHGFAGGIYDPDTKLVRFGARDYNPEAGSWTSKDPISFQGGDTNLYGYAFNDSINFIDPNGTDSWMVFQGGHISLAIGTPGGSTTLFSFGPKPGTSVFKAVFGSVPGYVEEQKYGPKRSIPGFEIPFSRNVQDASADATQIRNLRLINDAINNDNNSYSLFGLDGGIDLPPKKRTRVSCGFRQFLVVVRSHVFDRGVESA